LIDRFYGVSGTLPKMLPVRGKRCIIGLSVKTEIMVPETAREDDGLSR